MATRSNRLPLLSLLLAIGLALAGSTGAQEQARPVVVVELFTSQGCSSCPPSNAYLHELSRRPDIVALSFHIDYWDYIGWEDPFAEPEFTERQRGYARNLKQRYVYTPEMVVQGRGHDSGIDRRAILDLIATAQRPELPRVAPHLVDRGRAGLAVALPALTPRQPCDVWLVTYDPERRTKVMRGENSGHELTSTNVVRTLSLLTRWDGSAAELEVPAARLGNAPGVAILVQRPGLGPILGAATLTRSGRD